MVDVTEEAKEAYKSAIVKYLQERCKTDRYLAEVYEMAVHYILEDSLDCEEKKSEQSAKKDVATDTNVVANEDDDEALEQRNEDENSVGETYKPAPKAKVKTIAEEAQLGFDF